MLLAAARLATGRRSMKLFSSSFTLLGAAISMRMESHLPPEKLQRYPVLSNTQVSPDSHLLRVGFAGRDYLGFEADIPTCIAVNFNGTSESGEPALLKKSYSPISHPNQENTFDLLVKAYPERPGGGVGAYLCSLQEGDYIEGKVKSQRIMHKSPAVLDRWTDVGMVAGGTGIAPLYQIVQILLRDADESTETNSIPKIHVLSINRMEQDILLKEEMDRLAERYPDRFRVTYALTGEKKEGYHYGRGGVELAKTALPDPSQEKVMVLVCGKDGFVKTWGGPIGRAPPLPDGARGPKIQGPLLGLLKEAGFDASQVFKY